MGCGCGKKTPTMISSGNSAVPQGMSVQSQSTLRVVRSQAVPSFPPPAPRQIRRTV